MIFVEGREGMVEHILRMDPGKVLIERAKYLDDDWWEEKTRVYLDGGRDF